MALSEQYLVRLAEEFQSAVANEDLQAAQKTFTSMVDYINAEVGNLETAFKDAIDYITTPDLLDENDEEVDFTQIEPRELTKLEADVIEGVRIQLGIPELKAA